MAYYTSSSSSDDRTSYCPCARVPLSLSSATSAEYGDVVSLARRIRASNSSSSTRTSSTTSITFLDGGGGGGGDGSTVSSASSSSRPNTAMNGDGGITPLHLAAQHGHAEAVYLLLTEGKRNVDTGLCITTTTMAMSHSNNNSRSNSSNDNASGSSAVVGIGGVTPLHRAAFSGAISSMRVLLSWGDGDDDDDYDVHEVNDDTTSSLQRCRNRHRRTATTADILAKDTSYGDLRTPLHKAIAGGRPLAVQLLLSTLRQRQLLTKAMHTEDGMGKTPLTLARQYVAMTIDEIEIERSSVRRWDVVAGGDCADWSTCLHLLQSAAAAAAEEMQPHLLQQPRLTTTLVDECLDRSNKGYPIKCNDNNVGIKCHDIRCRTAIWEDSFRLALASSIETLLNNNRNENNNNNKDDISISVKKVVDFSENNSIDHITDMTNQDMEASLLTNTMQSTILIESNNTPKLEQTTDVVLGRQCDSCGKYSTTLYRLTALTNNQQQQLVCRQCRRRHR